MIPEHRPGASPVGAEVHLHHLRGGVAAHHHVKEHLIVGGVDQLPVVQERHIDAPGVVGVGMNHPVLAAAETVERVQPADRARTGSPPHSSKGLTRRRSSRGFARRHPATARRRSRVGPRSTAAPTPVLLPVLPQLVGVRTRSRRPAGGVGGAEGGGLGHLGADDGDAEDVGLELHEQVVDGLPPSTRRAVERHAGVLLPWRRGRRGSGRRMASSAARARWALGGEAREAGDDAAGVGPPVRARTGRRRRGRSRRRRCLRRWRRAPRRRRRWR